MRTMNRWEPTRGAMTLQDQLSRVFGEMPERTGEESNLTAWAPAVDIYETENDLVIKADLPEVRSAEPGHSRREQHPHDSRRTQV